MLCMARPPGATPGAPTSSGRTASSMTCGCMHTHMHSPNKSSQTQEQTCTQHRAVNGEVCCLEHLVVSAGITAVGRGGEEEMRRGGEEERRGGGEEERKGRRDD
ncbi:unnamed protein product [Arctogadus glacialis]